MGNLPIETYLAAVIVLGVPLILLVVGIRNAIRNWSSSALETTVIKEGRAVQVEELLTEYRFERVEKLPVLPRPDRTFSRAHHRIPRADIPRIAMEDILKYFEDIVLRGGPRNLFFARMDSSEYRYMYTRSMMIGCEAISSVRFLGWIEIEDRGIHIEWNLMCSERRNSGTPTEEESHFEYGPHQQDKYHGAGDGEDLRRLWDIAFANNTTQPVAKKAKWFERYLLETWMEAIDAASSGLIPEYTTPHTNTEVSSGGRQNTLELGLERGSPVKATDISSEAPPPQKLKRRLREVDGE